MSQKPLAWVDSDDNVRVAPMPAYWAVMLTGRDTSSMVNMLPFEEKYCIANPSGHSWGLGTIFDRTFVKFPFLSNSRDIQPGELLVLPYDAGSKDMICENFPSIEAIHHK